MKETVPCSCIIFSLKKIGYFKAKPHSVLKFLPLFIYSEVVLLHFPFPLSSGKLREESFMEESVLRRKFHTYLFS